MKRSCVTALVVLASLPAQSPVQQPFVLTDGTPLRVRLNRNLSSADAKVGEPVDFDVVEDILVNGAVVIQRGSRVMATVTEAQPKGLLGKTGKLNVSLDHARTVLGEKIALRAVKENQRGGSGGDITTIATSPATDRSGNCAGRRSPAAGCSGAARLGHDKLRCRGLENGRLFRRSDHFENQVLKMCIPAGYKGHD